ncbi:penicillin-binding protein 1A [Herbaspirillum sp. RTI4]|nr:penicillin-binding protein 1A [Herbaspirillum sp. RTI4]MDY7577674.1 penicillin-binding protein 1A [Herbaspirillum sp. RTI4]MEA9982160.1 penicillin-binding protein 1A [Herbaspirillum sp. RTI4]
MLIASVGVFVALIAMAALGIFFIVTLAYPKLPEIDSLTDYRPKVPLRIFSADGVLIGEFGEERRSLMRINEIPLIMKRAVLAIEDDRFYEHGGVDYQGIVRATLANLHGGGGGASTITQQVARNFFLTSNEPTFVQRASRKFLYEIPLAWKIERSLSKDQILEVYMNQIYLGQRAYGFASAAQIYFGKNLKDITIAEAAMLAGLPKAPSAYNPVVNPKRAYARQQYILQRMNQLGYITNAQYDTAQKEELDIKTDNTVFGVHAEYVAEMARQLVYAQFKDETYTRGLNVFTTITKTDQDAAYLALRRGVMDYEKRHGYRGPEAYMEIPEGSKDDIEEAFDVELADHPANDDIFAAVVTAASPKQIDAVLATGEEIKIVGPGLSFATNLLSDKAPPQRKVKRGAIIRVIQDGKDWSVTQLPDVESALVSTSPQDGAIRALVGGFDFNRNKFNHVTQAWRQPGSSFKPFIYSSSLEKGLSPATIINDAPLTFTQTGGQVWQPKNYGSKFEGPISMRRALQKSINMVSIRILDRVGVKYAQNYITRFGFDAERHPPYLTMALGAGAVTPLQMATAFSVFANGGYKVNPYLISKITDVNNKLVSFARPVQAGDEANRVIDVRNAFIMDSMLRDVVRHGTGFKAMSLKRTDLAGKTGTTNDSLDAWFAGYQPGLVGIAWMGYDQPKSLGGRETGGGLALPIWINYMQTALKNVPNVDRTVPAGIIESGGDYYYSEFSPGNAAVRDLGLGGADGSAAPTEEKTSNAVKNELF